MARTEYRPTPDLNSPNGVESHAAGAVFARLTSISRAGEGPGEGHAPAGASPPDSTRGEKTGNRWDARDLADEVPDGHLILKPARSGGPFDPTGLRSVDVMRADDVAALTASLKGRWVLLTLTVDRKLWIGPEAAYQRCNERVREVAKVVAVSGVYVTAYEVQGKTGEGWPHWHLLIWAPDDRSVSVLKAQALTRWKIRTEHVDQDTGEVTVSRETIGFVDVQEARSAVGVGKYVAKYCTKRWDAVPRWMGESRRQLRKLRPSRGAFNAWERLGRHQPKRGSRRTPNRRRNRARTLFDRMAASGVRLLAFRRDGGRWAFARSVPLPASCAAELVVHGARVLRLRGTAASMRLSISEAELGRVLASDGERFRAMCAREFVSRREQVAAAWDLEQERRASEDVQGCRT